MHEWSDFSMGGVKFMPQKSDSMQSMFSVKNFLNGSFNFLALDGNMSNILKIKESEIQAQLVENSRSFEFKVLYNGIAL